MLICAFRPRARAVYQASRVQPYAPGTRRNPSGCSAVVPSRLSESPTAPAWCTLRRRSGVSVGVRREGHGNAHARLFAICDQFCQAGAPERVTAVDHEQRSRSCTAAVSGSRGSRSGTASARQCGQARGQARVDPQITMNGLSATFWCCQRITHAPITGSSVRDWCAVCVRPPGSQGRRGGRPDRPVRPVRGARHGGRRWRQPNGRSVRWHTGYLRVGRQPASGIGRSRRDGQ